MISPLGDFEAATHGKNEQAYKEGDMRLNKP
jgi:hypothetical protein